MPVIIDETQGKKGGGNRWKLPAQGASNLCSARSFSGGSALPWIVSCVMERSGLLGGCCASSTLLVPPQQGREGNGRCGACGCNRAQIVGGGAWFTLKGFISGEKWNVELCS